MVAKIVKTSLLILTLAAGACSSKSGTSGAGGGVGVNTGTGGTTSGAGGMTGNDSDGGSDASGAPTTIAGCGTLGTPQEIANCIINLPTDSVGQTVTFTGSVDYNTCKM